MAEALLYGIAQEVLTHLGSTALNELASVWGFKDELNKLNDTINTLKDKMLDAEEKQSEGNDRAVRNWLERLTMVIHAADDLFDEVATVAEQKKQSGENKVTQEVRTFISRSNQIAFAFKISSNIKKIRKKLKGIVGDNLFSSLVSIPHDDEGRVINSRTKRDQTCSHVDEDEVIGRENDKKDVLDLLLSSSTIDEHEELPVITIVGMGGMGKTTLAQLVYKDSQVEDYFELKLWVCVSDNFDNKIIIERLLKSATDSEPGNLEMDQLHKQLIRKIGDKKYLLVLDDVWNENREKWVKLRDLLKIGRKGSKILVTTRSKDVAKIMGTSDPHELQGLSEEKSWNLFQKMAFKRGQAEENPELVKVGKEIVKKCGHVPLGIRTLGCLLYGKEESKWWSVKDTSLAKIPDSQSDIMSILKVSYDHLSSPLKNCFVYCALFPKDYFFCKEQLIELWMAEGFIAPNTGQCLEEVGEEYFLILLHRGFFQDIERGKWGDIMGCKMHDFMHDLALKMAGCKCKVAKLDQQIFDDKILHLSLTNPMSSSQKIPINCMLNMKLPLRTFLLPEWRPKLSSKSIPQQLLKGFSYLRVLDLHNLDLKSLPSSIGKLVHLRYLDLSFNNIKKLPNSLTNLWNLQTLKLGLCFNLRTLPKNMRKLTNLSCLDVSCCNELIFIPSGIAGLTLLSKLPHFIVGHKPSTSNVKGKPTSSSKLSDLKNLNNLRGNLEIAIRMNENNMSEVAEADISCKHQLADLSIQFYWDEAGRDHDETVLEGLKPPLNLRCLSISNYKGHKLPRWAKMNDLCNTLQNLVRISLSNFESCQKLPTLSQLRFLKVLNITSMVSVEYMEGDISSLHFFPSLEVLELRDMEILKGWWKKGEEMESHTEIKLGGQLVPTSMQFPKISRLSIVRCPNLRMLPPCPSVENLTLAESSEQLSVLKIVNTMTMPSSSGSGCKLKELTIDNAEGLMFLPTHCLHQLSNLQIYRDGNLKSCERLGEVFITLSFSLQFLRLKQCDKLRSVPKGLEHLSALEHLSFSKCKELDITGNEDEDEDGGMPWKALNTSFRSLILSGLPKLVGLPSGLQHLTNLRSLTLLANHELKELPEWISCLSSLNRLALCDCPKLKSLPEAFRNLTALYELEIENCPGLTTRCQRPNGSDWPKIQHIPVVSVEEY